MSVEGPGDPPSDWDYDAPVLDEIVIPARGEKIFNIMFYGRDYSIYENDDNEIAKAYRMFEGLRKLSDNILSGGFYFIADVAVQSHTGKSITQNLFN